VASKKGMTTNFFPPLTYVAVFGSRIRDGYKSGFGIGDKHPGSATLPYRMFYWSQRPTDYRYREVHIERIRWQICRDMFSDFKEKKIVRSHPLHCILCLCVSANIWKLLHPWHLNS
jgi:hypothetical protein